jgi:RNA polymerase sigma-70 factor (ECF subfamily)
MTPTRANGRPAFAAYRRESDGVLHAHALQIVTLAGSEIAEIAVFLDPELFAVFGLPATHPPNRPAPH